MPLPTGTWQDPTQDPPYKKTGEVWDQTTIEDILENLHFLLGTDGLSPTAGIMVRRGHNQLGSPAGNITFSSIPGGGKSLLIVGKARSTSAVVNDNLGMRFNGDVGSNYDTEVARATNATAQAINALASTVGYAGEIPGTSVSRGSMFSAHTIWIPNYADTVAEKSWTSHGGFVDSTAANSFAEAKVGNWRSAAAITQVALFADGSGGNLATGTEFDLFVLY